MRLLSIWGRLLEWLIFIFVIYFICFSSHWKSHFEMENLNVDYISYAVNLHIFKIQSDFFASKGKKTGSVKIDFNKKPKLKYVPATNERANHLKAIKTTWRSWWDFLFGFLLCTTRHFPLILAEMNMNHRGEKTETQENSFACLMFMFDSDWSIKIFRPLGKIIHWIVRITSNYSNVDGKRDQKWFMQTTQSHDWCMNLLGLGTKLKLIDSFAQ